MARPSIAHLSPITLATFVAACASPHVAASPPSNVAAKNAAPSPPATTAPVAEAPASEPGSRYDKTPQHVLHVLRAPSPPAPIVSPTGDDVLLVSWIDYPSIARVAEPFLRLAGIRVEPKTRAKHDTPGGYGIRQCARDATLVHVATATE